MTAFWRGLPGGGLVYGNRSGPSRWFGTWKRVSPETEWCQRFMMKWCLEVLCPWELCPSKNLDNVSKIIMYGACVRDYIYGDFIVDLAVFSSLFDVISNGTTMISLNRLFKKIHASGYHPLSRPVSRNGVGVRRLIIQTMTNM